MKLKNEEIFGILTALNSIANEKVPAKLAWKINTARNTLQPFVETLQTVLDETRLRYAILDDDGNPVPGKNEEGEDVPGTIQLKQESIPELNREVSALLTEEVEVANVELSMSAFPDSMEFTPNSLAALQPILVD